MQWHSQLEHWFLAGYMVGTRVPASTGPSGSIISSVYCVQSTLQLTNPVPHSSPTGLGLGLGLGIKSSPLIRDTHGPG